MFRVRFAEVAELTTANHECRLVHRGQTIDADGHVSGKTPETDTLGFRWSAANNLFLTPGGLAADEWRANRSADLENSEREMRQFVWCLPTVRSKWEETSIKAHELASRIAPLARGIVPPTAEHLTAAMDRGKFLCHWVVVAWSKQAVGHIVDYGRLEVATDDLGVEQALLVAMREFKALVQEGWPKVGPDGDRVLPDQVWVDSGYMAPVVYAFCREAGERFRPAIGRGAAKQRKQWYNRPTRTGAIVKQIGENYHINRLPAEKLLLCEIDADYWKTWIHQRLSTPLGGPGAMTLFQASPQEHLAIAKHLTAEVKTEEFVAGKGVVVTWERLRRQNHWFDALYNASAAGHYCGVRLVPEKPRALPPAMRPTAEEWAAMCGRPRLGEYARFR